MENPDLDAVKRDLAVTAHPIMPIVRELARVAGDAGCWVHWGATTQDITDTGMVLQMRAAHEILRRDLVALILELSDLAETHRDTIMAGRTHAQQALPITFGFKVATWIAECLRQVERLDEVAPRRFVGELGGAVGTLAGFGPQGETVQRKALDRLGLGVPPIAWHASRDTIAEFVSLLALIGGTLARIANEVIQLQRTEIMELEEPFAHGKVGSSTMPHKRNPAHAERIVAIARLLRGSSSLRPSCSGWVRSSDGMRRTTWSTTRRWQRSKEDRASALLADPRIARVLPEGELDRLLDPTPRTRDWPGRSSTAWCGRLGG